MRMKRLLLTLMVVVLAAGWSTSSFAIGDCPADTSGQVTCGQQCGNNNYCYSNNFPREWYCYTYYVPPYGCWHDGTYDPCCVPKRTF